jgi:thioredoxin 1
MKPVAVSQKTFSKTVLESEVPVIVDFWAPWCGPCQAIGPVLESLANQYSGMVRVAKVNVDEEPELAQQFGIRGIPTLLVFSKGKQVDSKIGFGGPTDLAALFELAVARPAEADRRAS